MQLWGKILQKIDYFSNLELNDEDSICVFIVSHMIQIDFSMINVNIKTKQTMMKIKPFEPLTALFLYTVKSLLCNRSTLVRHGLKVATNNIAKVVTIRQLSSGEIILDTALLVTN